MAKTLALPVITKLPNVGDHGIPGLRRRWLSLLRIALLKCSDAIIAMTPEIAAELDAIGYPPTRILKVTNGIPLLPPIPRPSRPSSSVRAVYVGRLSPEKGLLDLLHAWKSTNDRATRPVKLTIIGEGSQGSELRALASALGPGRIGRVSSDTATT
jgi:glycosyltransferase involved in cell wall biosynthesis